VVDLGVLWLEVYRVATAAAVAAVDSDRVSLLDPDTFGIIYAITPDGDMADAIHFAFSGQLKFAQGIEPYMDGGGAVAPTITDAVIDPNGVILFLTFSSMVTGVDASEYGLTGRILSTAMGIGAEWSMAISPTVYAGDVRTLSYTGTGTVDGDDLPLAMFSGRSVVNSSEAEPPSPPESVGTFHLGGSAGIRFS
jgi:hypothetical protein